MNLITHRARLAFISMSILLFILGSARPLNAAGRDHPSLTSSPANQISRSTVPTNQIILKYRASADLRGTRAPSGVERMSALSAAAGVELAYFREMTGQAHVLRLPRRLSNDDVRAITNRLATLPDVEYAEPDAIMQHTLTPNDPYYSSQWHYGGPYGINAPAAWDITTGSSSIVVAVIDTGITNHADLAGRTVPGYDMINDYLVANDGNARDSDPSDPGDWITLAESSSGYFAGCPVSDSSWHGTHVAGTIGAASNNSLGVAGINWSAKILPVRVLGKCGGYSSDIVDGMTWAAGLPVSGVPNNANPAHVLNLSLGGYGSCVAIYQNAINAIVAAGKTVIVAAGNSALDASYFVPANCNGVVTVAATNRYGDAAYYTNYGTVVEISGPGGEQTYPNDPNGVLSTLNTGTTVPVADTYVYYQGTSMATPHVVGVASLLKSLSPSLTPAQVLQVLQNTVTPFPFGSACTTSLCGAGIVNAGSAVAVLPRITSFNPTSRSSGSGQFTLTVYGANFNSGSTVRWNGANRATTFISSSELRATILASDVLVPTTAWVSVNINHATYGSITTADRAFSVIANVFIPMVLKNYTAPLVGAPTLNPIDNADGDGSYNMTWTTLNGADTYTLEEDDNGSFTSPTPVYAGAGTLLSASGKYPGTYFYRVKGTNAAGDSAWSNTESVIVNPGTWTSIVSADFEGTFPSPWSVVDNDGATNGEYFWAKRDCRPYAGSYSGWGVGGGADGAGLPCGTNYPNMGSAWMSYGPFSLAGASAADLQFKLWLNTEQDHDSVCRYASTDGVNFYGYCTSGDSAGWIDRSLDLSNVPGLGNLAGQPNVWVVIEFYRDMTTNYPEGAYVDNIVLRKCVGGVCLSGSAPIRLGGQVKDTPQMRKLPGR